MPNNSSPYVNDNGRPSSKAITLVVSLGIAFAAVVIGPVLYASATSAPEAATPVASEVIITPDETSSVDSTPTDEVITPAPSVEDTLTELTPEPAPLAEGTPPPPRDDDHHGDRERPERGDHHHDDDHDEFGDHDD